MQFILKDNFIYITNNEGDLGSKIEADVVIKYVDNYQNRKFSYSVNGKPYVEMKGEKISISKEELTKPYIELKVKAVVGDDIKVFKSDTVAVTHAIRFGEHMDNLYPERIKQLEERLDRTHKTMAQVLAYLGIQEERIQKRGGLF